MNVLQTTIFTGPNRWSAVPTAELLVDAGARRGATSGQVRKASDQLQRRAWFDALPHLRAYADAAFRVLPLEKKAAAARLDEFSLVLARPCSPALLLAHGLRAFQLACGVPAEFVAARETDEPHVEMAAVEFEEAALLRGCVETALRWCHAATNGETIAAAVDLRQLVDLADDARLGPSSLAILRAATARGIPFRRLGAGSLTQLGEGKFQRRIWTAETDATSAIAESIAQDKELTKRLLRRAGVPVPLGRVVTSPEDAWKAAGEIGVPVAVKPRKANHARGISLNLTTRDEVEKAYDWAVKDGDDTGVIVEQYARGQQHRLLVIGQRLVAAARGESEFVVGDGRSTIRELVEIVNRDPRRGENYTDPLNVLKLDDSALIELGRQGLEPESIPAEGRQVLVQQVGDLTTDCTAEVHPENARQVVLAARVVGLDVAGMDVVAEDIRRPLVDQRGAILEVNAGPSLGMHVAPLHGAPQPVGQAIIERLFAENAAARVPVIAVTGAGRRAAVVEQIAEQLGANGLRVGRSTAAGRWVERYKVADGLESDREHVAALLGHPDVEAAVWESRPAQAWSEGLGCERVDVAVVTVTPESAATDEFIGGIRAVVHAVPSQGLLLIPEGAAWLADLVTDCRGAVRQVSPERLVATAVAFVTR